MNSDGSGLPLVSLFFALVVFKEADVAKCIEDHTELASLRFIRIYAVRTPAAEADGCGSTLEITNTDPRVGESDDACPDELDVEEGRVENQQDMGLESSTCLVAI